MRRAELEIRTHDYNLLIIYDCHIDVCYIPPHYEQHVGAYPYASMEVLEISRVVICSIEEVAICLG